MMMMKLHRVNVVVAACLVLVGVSLLILGRVGDDGDVVGVVVVVLMLFL
jgi:hypothetical protein